jgi:hypothetical protein
VWFLGRCQVHCTYQGRIQPSPAPRAPFVYCSNRYSIFATAHKGNGPHAPGLGPRSATGTYAVPGWKKTWMQPASMASKTGMHWLLGPFFAHSISEQAANALHCSSRLLAIDLLSSEWVRAASRPALILFSYILIDRLVVNLTGGHLFDSLGRQPTGLHQSHLSRFVFHASYLFV